MRLRDDTGEAVERLQILLLSAEACGPLFERLDVVGCDENLSPAQAQSAGSNRSFDHLAVHLEHKEAFHLEGMPGTEDAQQVLAKKSEGAADHS